MDADRAAEALFDLRYILDVIDVAVGQEEQPELDLPADEPIAGAIRSIEEDPAFGASSGVAIRLEYPAGERFVFHHSVLPLISLILLLCS